MCEKKIDKKCAENEIKEKVKKKYRLNNLICTYSYKQVLLSFKTE